MKKSFSSDLKYEISKEILELDLDTIHNLIEKMTEHENKCNEENRFVEAGMIKERLENIKKAEKIIKKKALENKHQEDNNQLEYEQMDALDRFNEDYDSQFLTMNTNYDISEKKLLEDQKINLEKFKTELEEKSQEHPNPSKEILDKNKVLNSLKKQKNYEEAHKVQQEIIKLTKKDYDAFYANKVKNYDTKLKNFKKLQFIEFEGFKNAFVLKYNELKKKRALEFDNLVQKYKNKHKDMDKNQKKENSKYIQTKNKNVKNSFVNNIGSSK